MSFPNPILQSPSPDGHEPPSSRPSVSHLGDFNGHRPQGGPRQQFPAIASLDWKQKSRAYRILSSLPGGEVLYRFAQKHFTRSLVPNVDRVESKAKVAVRYWQSVRRLGLEEQVKSGMHVDFGAGWHPTIPFVFHALGVRKQRLLDLTPVLDARLVYDGLVILQDIGSDLLEGSGLKPAIENPFPAVRGHVRSVLADNGMTYDAPYDGLLNKLENQVAFVTSTQVLLHIPEPVLAGCFREIFTAMQPGGVFMATVHLCPLYGGLTEGPQAYEHLIYSPGEWEKFGSSIMYYHRLKAADYRRLLEAAGFTIVEWDVTEGSPQDLATVKSLPVHESFSRYSSEELAARHLFFTACKPDTNPSPARIQ